MKRLLLSTTLILGTLTGVKGAGTTALPNAAADQQAPTVAQPAVAVRNILVALDQQQVEALSAEDYNTLKTATMTTGVREALFANTEATIYGILKSLTKRNPDVDIPQTVLTTSTLALSLLIYYCSNDMPKLQKGLVPITGALITKTVVDYITQAGINQLEFFRTWARTTACCMVLTYLILATVYEAYHSIENTPTPLWPITDGLALRFLSPLLQLENPIQLDRIRATWQTHLSDPEKIHYLSGVLAHAFLSKGITSDSEMKSHIENMLKNKTNFNGLLSLLP